MIGPLLRCAITRLPQSWKKYVFHEMDHSDDHFPEPSGPSASIITFREPPCLVLYAYVLAALITSIFWFVRRAVDKSFLAWRSQEQLRSSQSEKRQGRRTQLLQPLLGRPSSRTSQPLVMHQALTDSQGRELTFSGFVDCGMGRLVSFLVPLNSAVLFGLFGIILYDYYAGCEWSFPDQLCYVGNYPLFGSYDVNSKVFLSFWCTAVMWFFLLISFRGGRMGNLFRLHAPLCLASSVYVTVHETTEAVSSGRSRALKAWAKLHRLVGRYLGRLDVLGGMFGLSGVPSQTVPLCHDEQLGISYIEFRCVRYVLDRQQGRFSLYNPEDALKGGYDLFLKALEQGGLATTASGGKNANEDAPTLAVDEMYRRIGPNRVPFNVDSFTAACADEFATYFFLYQFSVYAVALWFSYWHYTILAMMLACGSAFLNIRVRLDNQKSVKQMIDQSSSVIVLRDGGVEVEVDSSQVMPGDIVKVQSGGWSVPCDLLLLRGAAVCDESTLTGESMPVQRLAPLEPLKERPPQRFPAKHVLVGGTLVLQTSGEECLAVATHTGVATQRGQLLLLILFPPKLIFKYDEQMAIVFAILASYAFFVMVGTMRTMFVGYAWDQHLPFTSLWAIGIFTCSSVLPCMLHIVLSIGQVVAARRLSDAGVFSVVPKRIALAGKVRVACFDKTGTLTESALRFFGVHCVAAHAAAGSETVAGPFSSTIALSKLLADDSNDAAEKTLPPTFEEAAREMDWSPAVLCAMASAHSLSPFSGNEDGVVGNAVEVNMFKATGWTLESQSVVRAPIASAVQEEISILKRFDFSHTTMTMSAVVQHSPSGERGIFCKGSFEHVVKLCRAGSVPSDFLSIAQAHALKGMYVLALAARGLVAGEALPDSRSDAEKDLILLGLLLFKNPLRPDTRSTIEMLREGEVRSVMITGDTAGTAISIAKEASLAAAEVPVLLGDLTEGRDGVRWTCQKDDVSALSEILISNEWLQYRRDYKLWREGRGQGARGEATMKAREAAAAEDQEVSRTSSLNLSRPREWPEAEAEQEPAEAKNTDVHQFTTEELVLSRLFEWCELAVTQRAFEWLSSTPCSPDLRKVLAGSRKVHAKKGKALSTGKGQSSLGTELLTSIRIFSRMTPTGKIQVVEGLMSQGIMTAMVGDGGNDSGALRTAHVGMALSSATSATVVAPFTTNRGSVAPLVNLLIEGRAALCTSFAGYKYNVHYGLQSSTVKWVMHYYGTSRAMTTSYLQDLVGFLAISYVITFSLPARVLVQDRPTSSLFSVYVIGSVVGIFMINSFCLLFALWLISLHEDYEQFPARKVLVTQWWKLSRNWETNTVFFIYTAQLFWSAAVFSFGYMFRLSWYRNIGLFVLVSGCLVFLIWLLLSPTSALTEAFQLVYEPVTDYEPWTLEQPSAALPMEVRYRLLAIMLGNIVATGLYEKAVVHGAVGAFLRDRCRRLSKHVTLRL